MNTYHNILRDYSVVTSKHVLAHKFLLFKCYNANIDILNSNTITVRSRINSGVVVAIGTEIYIYFARKQTTTFYTF